MPPKIRPSKNHPANPKGRRKRMRAAGALRTGTCRWHDVLKDGNTLNGKPRFRCGTCGKWWTSGLDGMPYAEFAREPRTTMVPSGLPACDTRDARIINSDYGFAVGSFVEPCFDATRARD